MIRKISEEAVPDLERMDPDWSRKQFRDALGVPGAGGVVDSDAECFVLGVAVASQDDQLPTLFVTRMRLVGSIDDQADTICQLKRQYEEVHYDGLPFGLVGSTTQLRDVTGNITRLMNLGWEATFCGCMQMRLTLRR